MDRVVRPPAPFRVPFPNVKTPAPRSETVSRRWDATTVLEIALKSLEGGPEMIASAATQPRELAHRSTNGIEVTLL